MIEEELQQYTIEETTDNNVVLKFIDFCDFDEKRYKESLTDLVQSANFTTFDLSETKVVTVRWFRLFQSFDQTKVGFILQPAVDYVRVFRKIDLNVLKVI
jgi:hypothetical protein